MAIVRVFMSTGARLAEVGGIALEDLDLDGRRVRVIGKGDKQRDSHLDPKAVKALDRYLRRARSRHADADGPWLWLGKKGRYTSSGISQMVRDRGAALGIKLHPHAFRHWRASEYKAAGLADGHIMALQGWTDAGMVRRYGKANEASQALEAAARLDRRRDL
jgi:integrase